MRRMKDGDGHGAPDEKEEVEVKGQEEGGEGQDDLSHSSLLKFVFVCTCAHVYSVYIVCGLFTYVFVLSPMYNKS